MQEHWQRETPQISGMTYGNATVDFTGQALGFQQRDVMTQQEALNAIQAMNFQKVKEVKPMQNQTRLVKVIIADPNQNIPLDKRILHMGEEKLTDLTDQELFFELNVKELLDKHNMERIGIEDKAASDRTGKSVYLEPARIRDLKMVVVTVATI